MASKYWIKLYHEIIDDPKMGRMPDRLWRRTIELFLIAGEQDEEGTLPKLGDMAYRLRLSDDELQNDLEELQDLNIVHIDDGIWIVTKFAERQSPVSDAERMRRYRERQRKEEYYGDDADTDSVTSTVTKRSQIRIDKNRLEENRVEELQEAFTRITGIPLPNNGSIYAKWLTEINEWVGLGVDENTIKRAYGIAMDKDYTIARPHSLTNFIRGEISKDNASAKKEFIGPDGEVIKI
jgi:hypothetical protein